MRLPSHLNWETVVLIFILLILDTLAQIFFKIGVTHLGQFSTHSFHEILKFGIQLTYNSFILFGVIAMFFAFFTWLALISKVDLSFAQPMTSLVFVTIPLCASLILNEPLHWSQIVGILFIVVGVFVISDDEPISLKSELIPFPLA